MSADAVTAVATVVLAAATVLLAIATALLAWAALRQLPLLRGQLAAVAQQVADAAGAESSAQTRHNEVLHVQHERLRATETLRACMAFGVDPVLSACTQRIWRESQQGKVYVRDGTVALYDVFTVANYLDGVAIGVLQGLFSDEIARDHLGVFVRRFVEVILPALSDLDGYEALVAVHARWYPRLPAVTYVTGTP